MTLTLEQLTKIQSGLKRLLVLAPATCKGRRREHIREFIDVGEYGLALDELAGEMRRSTRPVPAEAASLVERLATELGIDANDEYSNLSAFRAHVA
ncbi:MAG TPA: hypothetical protein VME47_25540 [Acetobacteraceae bacterium]|nr:hypothetical protein [Acetobacteraceae bacterium]